MNNKLLTFLEKVLGKSNVFTGDEAYFKCPLCNYPDNKKKLAIKLDETNKSKYMRWHCWRNPEHAGNNLFTLLSKINASDSQFNELKSIVGDKRKNLNDFEKNIKNDLNNKSNNINYSLRLPKEFIPFNKPTKSIEYKNAFRYITQNRKLSKYDILKYNIGYCEEGKYAGYVIIPSYNSDGELNYFESRAYYSNNEFRFKKPNASKNIVFNEIFINWNFPVVLTEGFFDASVIKRNAIPLLGKTIPESVKIALLKNKVPLVYLLLDEDALRESILAIEYLMNNDIPVHFVKIPEETDASELGFFKTWEYIRNSKRMDFTDLIKYKINI